MRTHACPPLQIAGDMMQGPPRDGSFVERELMDPHNIMESSASMGASTDGSLDFLKQPVDMGARLYLSSLTARLPSRALHEASFHDSPAAGRLPSWQWPMMVASSWERIRGPRQAPHARASADTWGPLWLTAHTHIARRRVHLQPRLRQDHRGR